MALSLHPALLEVPAQTGVALRLAKGDVLRVVDPLGQQVADIALFNADDVADAFSPGRTIDYNESIKLGLDKTLFSHRSTELALVVEDTTGVHDMLLSPCSAAMFARRNEFSHPSCHENLWTALRQFGIDGDMVLSTVNVFMDVRVEPDGRIRIGPPASSAGDRFAIEACCDLIVGLTACSSELTNDGRCKPIAYEVVRHP